MQLNCATAGKSAPASRLRHGCAFSDKQTAFTAARSLCVVLDRVGVRDVVRGSGASEWRVYQAVLETELANSERLEQHRDVFQCRRSRVCWLACPAQSQTHRRFRI